MTDLVTAERCAELIVRDLVAWSGPHCDVVVEPVRGCRYVAQKGSGAAARGFAQAKELRRRLQEAVARVLTEFAG